MKKNKRIGILMIFVFVIALLCPIINLPMGQNHVAAAEVNIQSINNNIYYGRNKLLEESNSTNLVGAYDRFCQTVGGKQTEVNLSQFNLTSEEVSKVKFMYENDHTEHYWISNSWTVSTSAGKVTKITYRPFLTGFDTLTFDNKVLEYLALVQGKTSDYEKALAIHDALVKNIVYDLDATNAHNCYGAIVGGRAVCEGYAEAYQYLLQLCGIQSFIVTGKGNLENHEWNLVRLNGRYYYTDVTWDDPVMNGSGQISEEDKPVFHAYFNITTDMLTENHTFDQKYFEYDALPDCLYTDMMHDKYVFVSAYDVDEIAAAVELNQNIGTAKLYMLMTPYDTAAFMNWLATGPNGNKNLNKIIGKTEFRNAPAGGTYKYSVMPCGREFLFTITGPSVPVSNISLNVTTLELRITNTYDFVVNITPTYYTDIVVWQSSNTNVIRIDQQGHAEAVGVGLATILVSAGEKTATCAVEVLDCPHDDMITIPGVPSTCKENGYRSYKKCQECNKLFDIDTLEELVNIPLLPVSDHAYSAWTDEDPASDCHDGLRGHYTCLVCDKLFDENHQEVSADDLVIPGTHDYQGVVPTWVWEGEKPYASFKCTNCEHEEKIEAETTEEVLKERTMLKGGEKKITATITFEGRTYSDEKTFKTNAKSLAEMTFEDVKYLFSFGNRLDWRVGMGIVAVAIILLMAVSNARKKKKKNKNKAKNT